MAVKMTMPAEKENGNAFKFFPDELWESILEMLDDSEDILNILNAFPELSHLSNGKQCSWLVGAVIPLIFPKLISAKDLRSCRLVSRLWRKAADRSLEFHPNRLPYSSSRLMKMNPTHFCYQKLPRIRINFTNLLVWDEKLLKDNGIAGNPFPGRCVFMTLNCDSLDETRLWQTRRGTCSPVLPKMWLPEAVPIFQRYGHHIWYLTIEFPYVICESQAHMMDPEILDPLTKCLSHLPNLKSLEIMSNAFPFGVAKKKERRKLFAPTAFPFKLESVNMRRFFDDTPLNPFHHRFMLALLNHDQVKKLAIQVADWKRKYASLLSNLSELCLHSVDGANLKCILKDLQNCPLQRLEIHTKGMLLSELLEALSYHKIESLKFTGIIIEPVKKEDLKVTSARKERKARRSARSKKIPLDKTDIVIQSVTRFCIKLDCLQLHAIKLLRSFELLENLTIEIADIQRDAQEASQIVQDPNNYEESEDVLFIYIHKLFNGEVHHYDNAQFIWRTFPYLKMLTVIRNAQMHQYVPETRRVFTTSISDSGSRYLRKPYFSFIPFDM